MQTSLFVILKIKMTAVVCYNKATTLSLVERQTSKKAEGRISLPVFFFKFHKLLLNT